MGRLVLGVIIGYIVIAAFVFVAFSVTYMVLGAEGSFQPGSYEVSGTWSFASVVLGFIGAVLGGLTASKLGKRRTAGMVLAGVVLVLGLIMAITTLSHKGTEAGVRQGEVAMSDAMQKAKEPGWYLIVNPLIGVVGVMAGARLMKRPAGV